METVEPKSPADTHPLDQVVWASLTGPHARFAQAARSASSASAARSASATPHALRYDPDVSVFAALPSAIDATAWSELLKLFGPDAMVALAGSAETFDSRPHGWELLAQGPGVQLVATGALVTRADEEAVRLGAADAEEMMDLVARTEPGPFRPRTYELGTYLGLRRNGVLVAMAGERLHPPGWTEISAVCTDSGFRRQGLAGRLVRAVAHGIRERGETPFLHAAASNVTAIRLYEAMGFRLRRQVVFGALRTPGPPSDDVSANMDGS